TVSAQVRDREALLVGRHEPDRAERRQRHERRLRQVVPGLRLRRDAALVPDVRASVEARVAVHELDPAAGAREAEPVVVTGNRREVAAADEHALIVERAAREGEYVRRGVVRLDPAEAGGVEVDLPERRLA